MKKTIFFAIIAIISVISVSAQVTVVMKSQPPKRFSKSQTAECVTNAVYQDSSTSFTQQFLKEFNGTTYRVVLNEFPYNGKRNVMLVYKMDRDMPAIGSIFNIAPSVKNFRVLVADDNKKLVALYEYNGELKVIEFK